MNKAYKVVFNETTGTYVAVAEIVSARGKASSTQENTIATTTVPQSVTGRFMGKVIMALLGLTTALAMPLAHASWINGGSNNNGTNTGQSPYAATSNSGIGIGSDTSVAGKAYAMGTNAVAIGSAAAANSANGVAIGNGATAIQYAALWSRYHWRPHLCAR